MSRAALFLILTTAALLTACGADYDADYIQRTYSNNVNLADSSRFTVTRVSVFRDKLAYDSKRGIYLITDTKTGQEMVGISGVGISDLARHSSGKTTAPDER